MDLAHSDLVAWSLARVKATADAPAKLFLARLSELDPSLSPLFGKTGGHHRRALARVHRLAWAGFRDDRTSALLRDIAQRCKGRTIGYRHQAVIMSAALWTLQRLLGTGFTRADRDAWIAYQQQVLRALEGAARAIGKNRNER